MKVMVIGGFGYTGSVLVQQLLARGDEVVVFDAEWFGRHLPEHPRLTSEIGDIRSDPLPLEGVDKVVHLANVANDPSVELAPDLSWEVNCLATMLVAEQLVTAGVRDVIFASSGSVYGVKEEAKVTEDLPLNPISVYNKTKMVAERVLMSYSDLLNIWIVRPATVCGLSPRVRLDLSVNLLTYHGLANGVITVFGGDQVRPNIHVDDLARVYQHFLDGHAEPGVYNAGFENMSILEIADLASGLSGADVKIAPSNDPRSYRQNSDKLLSTGYKPLKGVQAAIEELSAAYRNGELEDKPEWHTVKSMKNRGLM